MPSINGGYILQPRCFDDSDAAHFPPCTREVWFYLLRNVSHTDFGKYKKGQAFFSLEDIQKALSWSVGYRSEMYSKPQITKALRRLREDNMIETSKATRGVHVTVCNYAKYQDPSSYEGNGEGNAKAMRRQCEGVHLKQEGKKEEGKKELLKDSCAEPQKNEVQAPPPTEPPVIVFPLNRKGTEQAFYQSDIDQWRETFPGVDLETELLRCRQWNLDNPTKRKTKAGIRNHISTWLGKAQNGARNGQRNGSATMTARQQYMEGVGNLLEAIDGTTAAGRADGNGKIAQPLPGVGPQHQNHLKVVG